MNFPRREEAINIMKVIVHMLEEKYDTDRVEDAVEMAIKALEQEPCEDCISREEALNIIDFEDKWIFNDGNVYSPVNVGIALTSMKKKIKELPSIQPKPKTDVLDKIRAEIADIYCSQYCENPYTAVTVRKMALEIIDKYKAESEEQE